jgi:signal transduction histidine kinase
MACLPGDDEEVRHRKTQFTLASILVTPAGVLWGVLYFAFGEHTASIFPLAYAGLTAVDLLVFFRSRRFRLFRRVQLTMILILPVALQISLGGFVGSSGVILWSFLAVLMALLYGGIRESRWWLAGYVGAVVLVAALEPHLTVTNHLPRWLVLTFFVLNSVTVLSVAFFVLYSFVTDRRKLRELEVAYLEQEMMLRHSEKLATVGTLAAGVAHELNNPAAAARRASEQLDEALARLEETRCRLEAGSLPSTGNDLLRSLEERIRERADPPAGLSAMALADLETSVEDWLERHGVERGWELAPSLVEQGMDPEALSHLQSTLPADAIPDVLAWIAAARHVRVLVRGIAEATTRLSEIVGALKSYTYMDQAPVQDVDLHQGIDNTLVILRSKLGEGITVRREYDPEVPRFQACGGELNQVWTNLLDNAADALDGKGTIVIRTRRNGEWVVIEIEDDGPGIPDDIQPRIFDPFFTTKPPGEGTGMGLSTTHSIVTKRHRGRIGVVSRPGSTRFTVEIPIDATVSEA